MFERLFENAGLSLDRLRALVEVGASGSIVKAADGDPVKQSQFSRQIKELEDFFQIRLAERQGKGIRLTHGGRELARISRFFLLGLSNFQRGCLAEEQTLRIGACATVLEQFLLPILADERDAKSSVRFEVEAVTDDEIERRLHDLTLDFGVVTTETLSRPLQSKEIGTWRLELWVPRDLHPSPGAALRAFNAKTLPLVWPARELPPCGGDFLNDYEPQLGCATFRQARKALESRRLAAFLPDFLAPGKETSGFIQVKLLVIRRPTFHYNLAWNPRLLRLNSKIERQRDWLFGSLVAQFRALS